MLKASLVSVYVLYAQTNKQGDREKIAKIQAEVYESCEQLERLYGIRLT